MSQFCINSCIEFVENFAFLASYSNAAEFGNFKQILKWSKNWTVALNDCLILILKVLLVLSLHGHKYVGITYRPCFVYRNRRKMAGKWSRTLVPSFVQSLSRCWQHNGKHCGVGMFNLWYLPQKTSLNSLFAFYTNKVKLSWKMTFNQCILNSYTLFYSHLKTK
jgi:hypothetical protein